MYLAFSLVWFGLDWIGEDNVLEPRSEERGTGIGGLWCEYVSLILQVVQTGRGLGMLASSSQVKPTVNPVPILLRRPVYRG